MSTRPSTYQFGGLMRRYIRIVLRELWHSDIFRPTDKVYLGLSVRKGGTGVFLIRQSLQLGNCWLQIFQRFLMIFYCILEFSESFLILRIYDGSPRTRNFLHNSLNRLSAGVGVYKREWFHFTNNIITRALTLMSWFPKPCLICSQFLLLQPVVISSLMRSASGIE